MRESDYVTGKRVHVYINGDRFDTGKNFVIHPKTTRSFDTFLERLTSSLKPVFGAVRHLRTADGSKEVTTLDDLVGGESYVAYGQKFLPLEYTEIKPLPIIGKATSLQNLLSPREKTMIPEKTIILENKVNNVPGRALNITRQPVSITVYGNGEPLVPGVKVVLQPWLHRTWDSILEEVSNKRPLRTGALRRLVEINSKLPAMSGADLDDGGIYVACGKERFKDLPYGAVLPSLLPKRYPTLPPIETSNGLIKKTAGPKSTASAPGLGDKKSYSNATRHTQPHPPTQPRSKPNKAWDEGLKKNHNDQQESQSPEHASSKDEGKPENTTKKESPPSPSKEILDFRTINLAGGGVAEEEEDTIDLPHSRAWSAIGRRSPVGVRETKSPTDDDEQLNNKTPDNERHDIPQKGQTPVTERVESKAEAKEANSRPASVAQLPELPTKEAPNNTSNEVSRPPSLQKTPPPSTSRFGSSSDPASHEIDGETKVDVLANHSSGKTTPAKHLTEPAKEENMVFGEGVIDATEDPTSARDDKTEDRDGTKKSENGEDLTEQETEKNDESSQNNGKEDHNVDHQEVENGERESNDRASETKNELDGPEKTIGDHSTDEHKTEEQKADGQKVDDKKADEQKTEEQKTEEQKTEEQKTEEQKTEEQKPEEQKADEHKTEEQKTEEQKTEEQKTEEQKTEEQKPEEQKADEHKTEEQKTTNDVKEEDEGKDKDKKEYEDKKEEEESKDSNSKSSEDKPQTPVVQTQG